MKLGIICDDYSGTMHLNNIVKSHNYQQKSVFSNNYDDIVATTENNGGNNVLITSECLESYKTFLVINIKQ